MYAFGNCVHTPHCTICRKICKIRGRVTKSRSIFPNLWNRWCGGGSPWFLDAAVFLKYCWCISQILLMYFSNTFDVFLKYFWCISQTLLNKNWIFVKASIPTWYHTCYISLSLKTHYSFISVEFPLVCKISIVFFHWHIDDTICFSWAAVQIWKPSFRFENLRSALVFSSSSPSSLI